jgi:flagellar protein FliO/FliZ
MWWYLAKLALFLPLIAGFAWGSLRLAKRLEGRFTTAEGTSGLRIVETRMLSPTMRLAVIAFHDREILVSASKHGLVRLAEAPARSGPGEGSTHVG